MGCQSHSAKPCACTQKHALAAIPLCAKNGRKSNQYGYYKMPYIEKMTVSRNKAGEQKNIPS